MSIYSNDNIRKIAKLTTRELPQKSKNAKITVRENNGLYSIWFWNYNGLIVRSRVRWLEEGKKKKKKKSKYFCNLENRTWEKKNVYRLKDSSDNIISDQTLILKEIHAFIKSCILPARGWCWPRSGNGRWSWSWLSPTMKTSKRRLGNTDW